MAADGIVVGLPPGLGESDERTRGGREIPVGFDAVMFSLEGPFARLGKDVPEFVGDVSAGRAAEFLAAESAMGIDDESSSRNMKYPPETATSRSATTIPILTSVRITCSNLIAGIAEENFALVGLSFHARR